MLQECWLRCECPSAHMPKSPQSYIEHQQPRFKWKFIMIFGLISWRNKGTEVGGGWKDEPINKILLQILNLLLFAEEASGGLGLFDANDVWFAKQRFIEWKAWYSIVYYWLLTIHLIYRVQQL